MQTVPVADIDRNHKFYVLGYIFLFWQGPAYSFHYQCPLIRYANDAYQTLDRDAEEYGAHIDPGYQAQ